MRRFTLASCVLGLLILSPPTIGLADGIVRRRRARATRRNFLKTSALAGATLALGEISSRPAIGAADSPAGPRSAPSWSTSPCAGRS